MLKGNRVIFRIGGNKFRLVVSIEAPDPVEAIKYRMDYLTMKRKDQAFSFSFKVIYQSVQGEVGFGIPPDGGYEIAIVI